MSTYQSMLLGIRSSAAYFVSTFLFGVMYGIAATSAGIDQWTAMFMSVAVFSASAQFAALEFWQSPLPLATIALSVLLVSARNILLGMSMTHHFDGHSLKRRILWLFILNDPGVVTSFRLDSKVDRLGYVTGYGLSLMLSWMLSTWLGLAVANLFADAHLGAIEFAGPLVMATMMMLFARGSSADPLPWILSGVTALVLTEMDLPTYLILLLAVLVGIVAAVMQEQRKKHD